MSGDGKRGVGLRPKATAPIFDSTTFSVRRAVSGDLLTEMANAFAHLEQGSLTVLTSATPARIPRCFREREALDLREITGARHGALDTHPKNVAEMHDQARKT